MISTEVQQCPNKCRKQGFGTIALHDKKRKRLRCRSCGKTWSAYTNTPHFGLRTPRTKIQRVVQLLENGFTIRKIARLVEVSEGTVMRWKKRFNF